MKHLLFILVTLGKEIKGVCEGEREQERERTKERDDTRERECAREKERDGKREIGK